MAPDSKSLDLTYANYMKNHPFGTALYTPQPYSLFHPGSVGYFDRNGSWNPIADLSSPDDSSSSGYKPVSEPLERAPQTNTSHWGPKVSSTTKAQRLGLEAGISAAVASALPADIGAWYHFTSGEAGGAVLLTKSPLRHEKYYYESPFKVWIRDNASLLLERRKEILEYGLWIVTSTWSTEECAINVWTEARRGVGVGFKTSAVGLGELAPSGDWYEDARDEGWLKVKAEKDDEGAVVFFGGLRFTYRRIPFGEKLKSKKSPKSFRHGAESAELETVAEIPIPADMVSEEEVIFAVDCEPALEFNFPGQALGGEVDVDEDNW